MDPFFYFDSMTTIKLFAAIGILASISSCSEEKDFSKKKEKIVKNEGLIIGDPLDCGLDSITLFPVGSSYVPEIVEAPVEAVSEMEGLRVSNIAFTSNSVGYFDQSASVEYVNDDNENYDIRNLLFYNSNSGESYPLILDSLHILSFAVHKEFTNPMIIYRVVKEDYNEDGKHNGQDPVMLYVSDLSGMNFQAVTPPDEFYIEYTLKPKTNSIIIKTAIDSNNDKKFLADDETNFRSMKLDDPKMSKNIFDESLKDKLRMFQ
jgi:hypothetical protein